MLHPQVNRALQVLLPVPVAEARGAIDEVYRNIIITRLLRPAYRLYSLLGIMCPVHKFQVSRPERLYANAQPVHRCSL